MRMITKTDLLTVKEFAKIAGKRQQTIYKQLNNRLNPFVQLVESHKMLERRALHEVYGIEVEQPIQPKLNNLKFNSETTLYEVLRAELEAKNKQITAMQQEIAGLQSELALERQHNREQSNKLAGFAEVAQRLHAGTIQQQLTEGGIDTLPMNFSKSKSVFQKCYMSIKNALKN